MKIKIIKNIKGFSQQQKNKSFFVAGFSLMETIIYVAIFSMFVFSLVSFQNMMTNSRINSQAVLEVNNQGNDIIKTITQTIRNAGSITSLSSNNLILATSNGQVTFSVNGTIFEMNGIALTNDKVSVSSLTFSNLSQPVTPIKTVKVEFTLSNIPNSNMSLKSVNFYGSATLRK